MRIILKESQFKKLIKESASPLLYHFCGLESLKKMLTSNTLFLSSHEQEFNGKDMNYMSFTRNRNSVQGYPYMQSNYSVGSGTRYNDGSKYLYCRLEIDGNALNIYNSIKDKNNQRHKLNVKPFDYFYKEMGLGLLNGPSYSSLTDDEEERYRQPFSQAEDRLISTTNEIPNMDKYLKSVDVFIDINAFIQSVLVDTMNTSVYYNEMQLLYNLCNQYKINVYTNRKYFDLGKEKNTNNKIINAIIDIFKKIYQTRDIWLIRELKNFI